MPAATNPHSSLAPAPGPTEGVPNWIDLHTAQPTLARVFYEALFDWTYQSRSGLVALPDDSPGPPSPPTGIVALSHGQPVAEIVERSDTFDDLGLVSSWFPYVRVSDIDAVLRLVEPAGGLVLSSPAQRGTAARVATILDPSDALLCLWEPIDSIGAPPILGPGGMTWIELETPEVDIAAKFYGELFGWDAHETPPGPRCEHRGSYTIFTKSAEPVAGAIRTAKNGIAASWSPSFSVTDVDGSAEIAARNGGVVMDEPSNIPVGRQAVIVDPTGAALSILSPASNLPRPL